MLEGVEVIQNKVIDLRTKQGMDQMYLENYKIIIQMLNDDNKQLKAQMKDILQIN